MGVKSTQSRKRGQGGNSPLAGSRGGAPLWGLGQRPNCSTGDQYAKRAQQRCRQRSVPASNFAHPQMRPPACSFHHLNIVAPIARPSSSSFLFMLAHCDTQGFRLCGGDEGAMKTDECLRSPPQPLRCALPCFLVFIVESGTRLRALLRDRPR